MRLPSMAPDPGARSSASSRRYRGPAYLAIGVLTFVQLWNSYFLNTIYLARQDSWVLTQALQSLIGRYQSEYGAIMAGVTLVSDPDPGGVPDLPAPHRARHLDDRTGELMAIDRIPAARNWSATSTRASTGRGASRSARRARTPAPSRCRSRPSHRRPASTRMWPGRALVPPRVRLPSREPGHRLLLHFEGVDHDASVWVNGRPRRAITREPIAVLVRRHRRDTRGHQRAGGARDRQPRPRAAARQAGLAAGAARDLVSPNLRHLAARCGWSRCRPTRIDRLVLTPDAGPDRRSH